MSTRHGALSNWNMFSHFILKQIEWNASCIMHILKMIHNSQFEWILGIYCTGKGILYIDEYDVYSQLSWILNINSIVEMWISGIVFSFIHSLALVRLPARIRMKGGRVLDSGDEAFQTKSFFFLKKPETDKSARQKRNIQLANHRIRKN